MDCFFSVQLTRGVNSCVTTFFMSSAATRRHVDARSPEVLTSYVFSPKASSFTIAVRMEFVQDYSEVRAMITTLVGFFGETIKDGSTTLEYRVGNGDVWSLLLGVGLFGNPSSSPDYCLVKCRSSFSCVPFVVRTPQIEP